MKASRLLVALFALLLSVFAATAQSGLPDLGGRVVTVAVENAYPPFNFLDETGQAVGWDYDAVNEMCARLNCVPEYIETSWEGMILAVSNGEYDMAADGITITEERRALVDFSMGYANIIERLMVRLGEDRFATVEDFVAGDFTVGVQLATTNFLTAQSLVGDARIVGFSEFGAAVQALIAGDVDAVVIDDMAGLGYEGANEESVELLEDPVSVSSQLGFIFPKGSDLVAAIDAALMSMVEDGTLNEINARWGFGEFEPLTILPDLGGRVVTVAVENAYPPFNFLDETGQAIGWDYDAVNEMCARLNCVPEYIETSWEGMILAVSNGEYDMAADGITITEERRALVDFSTGYANIIERLMVRLGEDRFATVEDFVAGDFTVGVQLATTNFLTAQSLVGDARIVGFSEFGAAVQALIAGDVDAVVIDDVAGQGYVGENDESVELLEDPVSVSSQLGFIFPKGSDLVAAIDAALMSMVEDGTLNEINARWGFGDFEPLDN